ncbi:mucin-17-like isoform X2 [Homarus americanus]|uniref:mucin-17-like isoform X2 n=1 Tax=Homarus americanus TaxID=6706 RepID=UPI001C45DE61|nr:mucin-17-like isoform X2 [Homarus americanus]
MFGFFKNKNKDKVVTKDKNSDSAKDKKKDKVNKEDKDVKVTIRKGKEDKPSKSIFRKSKSIERIKEANEEPPVAAKKSRTLGARGSGEWPDSGHEDPLCHNNGTEGEDSTPPIHSSSSSSEGVARPSSPVPPPDLCQGGRVKDEKPSPDLKPSTHSERGSRFKYDCHEIKKYGQDGSWGAAAKQDTSVTVKDGDKRYLRSGREESKATSRTKPDILLTKSERVSGGATPLVMKPPLNPRMVAPRGPLASSPHAVSGFTHVLSPDVTAVEKDDSRYTPSPGLATPPSSPGLPSAQAVPPYPIVTGPPSRPTSPDGRASMLSTPSSSTSSLSSLSARPISPSGRRTPPGPRMGTGGRLTSSPTPGRKAVRTNIKTNPAVVSRRAGSRSPVNPSPSPSPSSTDTVIPFIDGDKLKTPPSSPDTARHLPQDQVCPSDSGVSSDLPSPHVTDAEVKQRSPPPPPIVPEPIVSPPLIIVKTKAPLPLATVKPRLSSSPSPPPKGNLSSEVKPETGGKLTPRSVSPTAGKSRHSISSMHSLESIPENDSEGQTSSTDTLEKNRKAKGTVGSKSSHPLSPGRESKESASSGVINFSARHSVPEVSSGGQHHGVVSHKRSSSLTPVNEEKLLQCSAATIESSVNPQVNVSTTAGTCHNGPVRDASGKLDNNTLEYNKGKDISYKNEKKDENHDRSPSKEQTGGEILTGNLKNARPRTPQYGVVSSQRSSSQSPVKDGSSLGCGKVCGGDSEKVAVSSSPPNQPIVASLAAVTELGIKKTDVGKTRDNVMETDEARGNKFVQSSDSLKSSASSGGSEVATHVVFRIPLRRCSLTNGEETEKRVSVEILKEEEGKRSRKEKVHYKERPRSVSTSRELRREKSSELLTRRRLASEGPEGKSENSETKDGVRERVRRRSSSSIRRHRSRGEETHCEEAAKASKTNSDDKKEEDLAPWRRSSTRSRSRVSKSSAGKQGATNVDETSDQSSTGYDADHVTDSSDHHMTRSVSKGSRTRGIQEKSSPDIAGNDEENHLPATSALSKVTAPPRQRSKSRGAERRMTRSATISEIRRARDIDTKPVSAERDSEPRRRAQSSSRVPDTSRHTRDADTCGTPRRPVEDDAAGVHRPPRRRSLSTKRRSSGSLRAEREDILRPDVTRSRPSERVMGVIKSTRSRKEENGDNVRSSSLQLEDNNTANKEIDNKETNKESETNTKTEMDDCNTKDVDNTKDIIHISGNSAEAQVTNDCSVRLRQNNPHDENTAGSEETAKRNPPENTEKDSTNLTSKNVRRRSVQLQTQAIRSVSQQCQTDLQDEETRLQQEELDRIRKELAAQEERYQKQVDQLTISLAEKQQEVANLTQTIETLKGAKETLEELQEKLSLLQQDVRDRSAQMDCLRVELQYSKNEVELTKSKLKKLEEDLDTARQKNLALQNQITATANCDKTEELETKIKSLEETLKATQEERDKLTKTIEEIETERDEEIKIIQDALDEAAQEREELIATFEKEFQNMNTMNSTREQQLMEDFEWKLREMEKDHKKKVEERERKAEERINAMRNLVESELADSLIKVAEDRRIADEQLAENTLHRAKRQAEEAEAEFRQKQEKMKNELNAEWEDKLRSECSRLKAELDDLHAEEKHLAVESMKVQKEQEQGRSNSHGNFARRR